MARLADARVLVTGATGFIGSALVRRLLAEGAEVHALTSTVSSVYPVRLLDVRKDVELHEANLTDPSAMTALARAVRPERIFHLGAYTHVGKSWQRVDECVQANVQGTVNLLQALEPFGYERFVYTGTSEIYGDVDVPFREDASARPISPYSVSKYAGERFCQMFHAGHGWPIVMVRPFNAYGPAQSPDRVIPEIIVRALRGQPIKMTQGRQTREFNFVNDLAGGFVAAGTAPGVEGQVINLGCGREIAMRDLALLILGLMGSPVEAEFGAIPDRPTEIWRMFADTTKAAELLDWRSEVSLEDGLQSTIEWYRAEIRSSGSQFAL